MKEFDVSSVAMPSRSILSFFKKLVNTVNNGADDVVNIPESSWTVVNSDVNSEYVSSASNCCSLLERPYIHRKILCFRKLSLDLEILVPVNITGLITIHGYIMTLKKIV